MADLPRLQEDPVEDEVTELSDLAQALEVEAEKYRSWQLTRRALIQHPIPFTIDREPYLLEGRVTTEPEALLRSAGKDTRFHYIRIQGGESYRDRAQEMIVLIMGTRFVTVDTREDTVDAETSEEEHEPREPARGGDHRVFAPQRRSSTKRGRRSRR